MCVTSFFCLVWELVLLSDVRFVAVSLLISLILSPFLSVVIQAEQSLPTECDS